jgi:SAM-dependent methyltransferase
MKQWYETFFDNFANNYEKEHFTQGTSGECDFIEGEIGKNKSVRILDIGCGTGRHAIELARRGYDVTGVDLSQAQLELARKKARAAGVKARFYRRDARMLKFRSRFDLALMICEGAFPLMETDEMNFQILEGAARSLKSGGKLIFTTLNGLFPLFHSLDEFFNADSSETSFAPRHDFDLMTMRDNNLTIVTDDSGKRHELRCNERYYMPSEISWLLKSLGFENIGIFGARLGEFSRKHKLRTEDFEMLVVAEKR